MTAQTAEKADLLEPQIGYFLSDIGTYLRTSLCKEEFQRLVKVRWDYLLKHTQNLGTGELYEMVDIIRERTRVDLPRPWRDVLKEVLQ